MPKTFICIYCGKVTACNPRVKNQRYCSSRTCQNARKRKSEQKASKSCKNKTLRKQRNKRWRDTHPAHEYQENYRKKHPGYVNRNRELQKNRNKKRQSGTFPMIVKTDALLLQPTRSGVYIGFKLKRGKIVKTDALMLQMHLQQSVQSFLSPKPG